ncbi:MAG: hypothetical protein JXR59_10490 [Desulfuromonadaceae bacterium]|nr:hypothetical protein [Desulfuromonadaceae bacterium]
MTDSARSRTENHLNQLLEQVEPGSTRYTILFSAKRFKSSWIELGELLSNVRHQQLYRDWGYEDFAQYCSREIRIRRQTADKLTQAYHYLEREYPTFLENRNDLSEQPDFRSVNLLWQASEEQNFSPETFNELQQGVFSGQLSHQNLARQVRDARRLQKMASETIRQDLKNALSAARRLQSTLVPLAPAIDNYYPPLDALITQLQQHLDELDAAGDETNAS